MEIQQILQPSIDIKLWFRFHLSNISKVLQGLLRQALVLSCPAKLLDPKEHLIHLILMIENHVPKIYDKFVFITQVFRNIVKFILYLYQKIFRERKNSQI